MRHIYQNRVESTLSLRNVRPVTNLKPVTNLWIDIVAIITAVACALGLLIAMVGAVTAAFAEPEVVQAATNEQSFDGMVECSKCGAKHSSVLAKNAADCVRICAHTGATFTLVDGENAYQLDGDTNILKQLATRRVHVVGEIQANTIRVASIAPTD